MSPYTAATRECQSLTRKNAVSTSSPRPPEHLWGSQRHRAWGTGQVLLRPRGLAVRFATACHWGQEKRVSDCVLDGPPKVVLESRALVITCGQYAQGFVALHCPM
jgi:hypothetical protein